MRLFLLTITLMMLTVVASYSIFDTNENEYKHKNKAKGRAIRGFLNRDLSTARGFGKRNDNLLENFSPADLPRIFNEDTIKQNIPIEWISKKMSNDQNLARVFMENFVDTNHDGHISVEELLQPLNGGEQ
ncbi:allatotropins-like [Adelges cooleyi]|uniref:allatotropins-like n=1 Tax=Adelges cooleyi TaxID=133065 RepID=UPI0021807B16|nr:allatotropins-like [Adelges cooleyi]XP_050436672.1 allatotropins-like [Adelges cooleyi]